MVRNGRARERQVTVRSGTVPVWAPRLNDKRVDEETGERQRFSSKILSAYVRRSPKVTEVLPIRYLRGISTGDFRPALEGLLGEDASGLSASTISRLCKQWETHHERFGKWVLSFSRYKLAWIQKLKRTNLPRVPAQGAAAPDLPAPRRRRHQPARQLAEMRQMIPAGAVRQARHKDHRPARQGRSRADKQPV